MNNDTLAKFFELRKVFKDMTPQEVKQMQKSTKKLQDELATPTIRKQMNSVLRWRKLFAPNIFRNVEVSHMIDIARMTESSKLDEQINQIEQIKQKYPEFNKQWSTLYNQLSRLSTLELQDFFNNHISNDSAYNDYVDKRHSKKNNNDYVPGTKIINNGVININSSDSKSTSTEDKITIFFSLITIIITLIIGAMEISPKQAQSNLSEWINVVRQMNFSSDKRIK